MNTTLQPEGWLAPRGYANGISSSAQNGQIISVAGQIGWNAQCQFESDDFAEFIRQKDIPMCQLGQVGGDTISFTHWTELEIPLANLRAAHEGFFPALMGADAALA